MRIQPIGHGSCRIESQALNYSLSVRGLDAKALNAFLSGIGSRPIWPGTGSSDVIRAELLNAEPGPVDMPLVVRELDDGKLETRSGGPGQVIARPGYHSTKHLLPQSLHLLLAQQWARAGILTLHAAVISTPQGGVLILGPRGGGKSVLAMSALAANLGVVSDDWLLLGRDAGGSIQAERLRAFLMLRRSWATDQLSGRCARLLSRELTGRNKKIIPIPPDSPVFPAREKITRVWLLNRPRGARSGLSQLRPTNPAQLLGRLVEASMPLLFSTLFKHEHQAMLATARQLIASARGQLLETGTDLVDDPQGTWSRLTAT